MTLRRLLQGPVAVAVLVWPLAAFAQPAGSVTTAPFGQGAPALGIPMLVALLIALIGLGAYSLRARSVGAVTGFVLVAGLSVLAVLSYADGGVVVEGAQCNTQTVQAYDPAGATLTSLCPNPIQIVVITCSGATDVFNPPLPSCTVGQTLTNGQQCVLPTCVK